MKLSLKKLLCGALSAAVIMSFSPYAAADVIMEPFSNDFYSENMEDCKYIYWRRYTVINDCELLESPLGSDVIKELKAGEVITLDFSYTDKDGNVWGSYLFDFDNDFYGWVRMSDTELIYDRYSFDEDHSEEYVEYSGEFDDYKPENQVVLWTYPGSGEISFISKAENWFTDPGYFLSFGESADKVYTDENGDKWIFFGYNYWAWVYLPDPESESINGVSTEFTQTIPTDIQTTYMSEDIENMREAAAKTISPDTAGSFGLPIGIAAAAAAVSGVSLMLLRKKKK